MLVKDQKELSNTLQEIGGKQTLVISWQNESECINHEIGHLAEETSKHSVDDRPRYVFLLIIKSSGKT